MRQLPTLARGWRYERLGNLVQLGRPVTYGVVQPGDHDPTGVPLVRGTDFSAGWRPLTEMRRVSVEVDRQYSRGRLEPGDLVITIKGAEVGTVEIVPDWLVGANLSQTNARVALNSSLAHARYVLHFLRSDWGKFEVYRHTKVGAQPGLIFEDVESFHIPLPGSLSEQVAIAEVLDQWDNAIETTTRLIAAKERCLNARITTLFQKKEGRYHTFGDFLSESQLSGTDGARARKLSVKLYGKGVVAKSGRTEGSSDTKYFIRRSGQLVYSKLDFLNGAFGIVPIELDGYESTLDLPAFNVSPAINPIWLLEYLRRPEYYTRQTSLARGQRIARRVNPADFLASDLRVPPREHQDTVAAALTEMRKELALIACRRDALVKQKRGLMQKLLTGEWPVSAPKSREAAE